MTTILINKHSFLKNSLLQTCLAQREVSMAIEEEILVEARASKIKQPKIQVKKTKSDSKKLVFKVLGLPLHWRS